MFEVFASTIIEKDGKYLLVQEGKKTQYGLWNLTGGHVDPGEKILSGAVREAKEETGTEVAIDALLNVFTDVSAECHSVHFIFTGHIVAGEPTPHDDILQCSWYTLDEIKRFPDNQLLNAWKCRAWIESLEKGVSYPVSMIAEK